MLAVSRLNKLDAEALDIGQINKTTIDYCCNPNALCSHHAGGSCAHLSPGSQPTHLFINAVISDSRTTGLLICANISDTDKVLFLT